MKTFNRISFILVLSFFTEIFPQKFLIDSYNTQDGLIQSSVVDIIQDDNGLIWLYSEKGISAFDGHTFYNYVDSVELFNSWLVNACTDSNNNVFMQNLRGQVWKWDRKNFTRINLPPEVISSTIGVSSQDELIVGSVNAGIFILHNNNWINLTASEGLYSNSILSIDSFNNITFILTTKGLNKIIKDKPAGLLPFGNVNIKCFFLDSQSKYWFGTEDGLYLYDNELKKIKADNLTQVENICEDGFGTIWIAARTGLYAKTGSGKIETEISNSDFRSLLVDKEGIVWAGTIGKGVFTIKRNPFLSVTQANGFSFRSPFPIHKDLQGRIWIGTDHGMAMLNNGQWEEIKELNGKLIINLFEDADGDLWIINSDEIYKYSNNRLKLVVDNKSIPPGKRFVTQLKDGSIIIGTSKNGLWKLADDNVAKFTLTDKLNKAILYSSFKDSSGNVWIGTTNSGIIKINGGEITTFDSAKGITAEHIFQFSEDAKGNVWVGTSGGVFVIDKNDHFKKYTTEQGLVSNTCYSVITNESYAFVGTSDGVNLIDGDAVELFTYSDGLLNNDCNTNSFLINDNNLWIGTYDGISIINLTEMISIKRNMNCVITKLKSNNTDYDILADRQIDSVYNFVFEPGDNDLIFSCAGLYYTSPSSLNYTYQLKSSNSVYIVTTNKNYFELKNAEPGEYIFCAKAKSPAGPSIQSMNTIMFTIEPQFYQTASFYILLFAIALIGASVLILYFSYSKKKKLTEKYKTSSLTPDNYPLVKKKLTDAVEIDEVFRDADLTLSKLAERLNIHKEHISQVINKEYGKNFNEFINTYRIEEAKKFLSTTANTKKNILAIAHEVGFNSKTTFNTTFKRLTGLTPTEFKYSKQ